VNIRNNGCGFIDAGADDDYRAIDASEKLPSYCQFPSFMRARSMMSSQS